MSTTELTRKGDYAFVVPDSFTEANGRGRLVKFLCTHFTTVWYLLRLFCSKANMPHTGTCYCKKNLASSYRLIRNKLSYMPLIAEYFTGLHGIKVALSSAIS